MEYEGGSNIHEVPGDPGGLTKWGVSQRAYPHLNIPHITRTRALEIFTNDYWTPVRAESLPENLRLPVADFAFNAGVGLATRKLQQAVNLCKQAHRRRDLLEVDGQLGPITMGSLDDYPPERLALVFLAYRIDHYMKLAEAGRSKFIYGWLKRASEIHHYGTVKAYLGDYEGWAKGVTGTLRANGQSQAALARAADMDESRLSRYLSLRVQPSMESMLKVEAGLEKLTGGP
jgi:lysozyme family protein